MDRSGRKSLLVVLLEIAGAVAITVAADPTMRRQLRPAYLHAVMTVCQRVASAAGRGALRAEAAYRREVAP